MTKRIEHTLQPFTRRLIPFAVAACFASTVYANPTGQAVVSGAATFNAVGKNLTVTNTPGAIINWQGFSIRADELTRFIQPNAASAVLNRVTGPEHSALLGQLLSNGRVFLINPNGVTVGAGAVIDTAGFIASSLNLSNEDFLAGKFRFTDPGNAGKVVNSGTINAGSGGTVYLIAPTVENHGVITAPGGEVMLAAGKSVEIVSAANPDLRVQVQAGGEALNVGQLLAESGRVGIFGAAIRNSGTVSADSAQVTAAGTVMLKASRDVTLDATSTLTASGGQGGSVTVQAEAGTLLADGRIEAKGAHANGGEVKLLGTQVGLVNQASIDASGRTGGGTVLVGGDYQGKNSAVQTARATYVGEEATIRSDATDAGDGGRVIVWSDEYTGFYGAISARGGPAGGNGGLVETSSKDNLQAMGSVDAAAPLGRAGEWLLDPSNVTISGGATTNGVYSGGSPNIFTTTANNAVANVTTLQTSLNAGTSVTINTTPGGAQAGNITLAAAAPITKSAGGNAALTLNAQNNIVLNAGITSTSNTLDVNLNAGLGGAGTITLNNMSLNGGALTVNAPGNVTQTAATTLQAATSVVKQGAGTMTLSQANTYTGTTNVQAGTLTVTNASGLGAAAGGTTVNAGATLALSGTLTWDEPVTLAGGTLSRAAGNPTLTGAVNLAADSILTGAGGTLALSGDMSGAAALTKTGAGVVVLSGTNTYTGATNINAGTLRVAGGSGIGDASAVNMGGGTLDLNGTTETIGSLAGTSNVALGAGTLVAGGNDATTAYSGVISGAAGGLTKAGAGTLTLSGNNTYTGATTINDGTLALGAANRIANASAVTVGGGATFDLAGFAETVGSIAGAGNITLGSATLTAGNATDTVFSGVISGTGGLTKVGAGMLELSGSNAYDGTTLVNAGTLVASNATSLGTTAGATTVANGATLNIAGASIGETLTIDGTGVGAAGALRGTGTAAVTGAATLATNSSIGADAGATLTLSGAIGQAGGNRTLTKVGTGTVVLSGTNTYAGATTVSAGTLTAASAGALGTTTAGTTVAAGATLNIDSAAIGAEAITLNGTLLGTGVASLSGTVALGAANSMTTIAAGDALTLSGVVSGGNPLNKNGAGTVVLAGAANNTYTGLTNVNAGTLVVAKAVALGTTAGGTTVANGATLQINNVAIGAEVVTLDGAGVGGAGALQGTGTASLTGTVTLASASAIGAPAAADTLTLSGVVGGANDLSKVGSGTVVLSGAAANTYGGATNVDAGTLRIGSAANKIPNASAVTVAGGATLDLNGFSETVGSLAGAGNVTLGAATLTTGANGASTVFSGVISGGGGLTKAGAGTLELSGASTYAGATNVNVGTLTASNATALGSTAGVTTVTNGATLNVNNAAIGAESVTINGTGVAGVGALTGTGAASLGGQVTVATGARVGTAAGNSLALNGTVQGPGALDAAGGGTVTFGNTVGNVTPLASLTSAAGTALNVNGGLVRTTGTQTFNGTLTTGGPTTLQTTNANVTANGAVAATAGTLTLNTGTGNVTMTNAANDFGTVAVTSGNTVALNDVNALTLGASTVYTLTATAGGALNVNGSQTASGAGDSIVLSGTSFVNNVGAGALIVPVGGRWVVYSTDPAGNTFNSLASGNQALWNATYIANPPATIPAGNRYVFSTPATLTFTSTDAAKIYGDVANVSGNYTVSGFVNAATYGNVFTQDTAANAFTGAPNVTSAGTPAIANVGPYPITVTLGTLASSTGYVLAFNSAGQLTVSARPISVQADNQARVYGDPNPTTGAYTITAGTLANADSITNVNVTSPATAASGVGPYALTPTAANFGTGTATNYTITFVDGVLTVTPRPITVTANNQTKVYGQPDPALTVTAPTVNGDVLNGTPVRAAGESVAGGPYAITQGTVTNAANPNYTITFVNGQLVITPANLTIAADDKTRLYGDANPPLTATFTGLTNGDTAAAIPGVALTTPAVPASNVGNYTINVASGANANYTITYVNGQLAITPAPLQIVADDKARLFGQPNPPFTVTTTGFKLGQTVADLNGNLVLATPATTTSSAGAYPIVPGGVSSTNYTITFIDGVLLVGQASPPADNALVSATGRNILLGSDAVPPGAVTNVDQCELLPPAPTQAGGLAATQRALNVAARGRPLGAPVCETTSQ